jgi:hypothetical protein
MITEDEIKSESQYMQMFGCDRNSFEAGVRWALSRMQKNIISDAVKTFNIPEAKLMNNKKCPHKRIEEIQGGQIERCLDCGKTWG